MTDDRTLGLGTNLVTNVSKILMVLHFCVGTLLASQEVSADIKELKAMLSKNEVSPAETRALFFRVLDEPRNLLEELFQLWDWSQDSGPPLLRVRIAWFLGRVINDNTGIDRAQELPNILKQAIDINRTHHLGFDSEELEFFSLEFSLKNDQDKFFEIQDQLLQKALKITSDKSRAYAFSRIAFHFIDRGVDAHQLPKLIQDTRLLLRDTRDPSLDERDLDVYNTLSMILRRIDQVSEADRIDKFLSDTCQQRKIRVFCSVRAYVTGYDLLNSDQEADKLQALDSMNDALRLASEVQDIAVVSQAQYGLNMVYNQLKRSQEAIRFGQLAAEGFARIKQKDWEASAKKNLSESYLIGGRLQDALDTIQDALASCPQEFKVDRQQIYRQLSKIHEARNDFSAALDAYKQAMLLQGQIETEDTEKKYILLRNETLTRQNKLKDEQIDLLKKFKNLSVIATVLAVLVFAILILVWRQSQLIKISRRRMMEVLQHIDLGIFMLNAKLKLKNGYSPHLLELLEVDKTALEDGEILNVIEKKASLSRDQVQLIRQILELCLGETEWNWEMNIGNLPHEIELQGKTLSIHWQALPNSQGLINRYLISLRDVTEIRQVQRKAQATESLQQKLSEVLEGDSGLIFSFISEISECWSRLEREIQTQAHRGEVRRRLHTWKGVARSLGLRSMAQGLHDLESVLLAHDSHDPAISLCLNTLRSCQMEYDKVVGMMRGHENSQESHLRSLHQFGFLYVEEMRRALGQDQIPTEGLYLRDQVTLWNSAVLKTVHELLLHALSNALDHGFRRPKKEGRLLRPAKIQIDAFEDHESVQVCLSDNGVGIAWDRLAQLAVQRGLGTLEKPALKQLIFEDGFSTARSLTETSGRGVGMHAIQKEVERLGGRCELESEANTGTRVMMIFPREVVLTSEFERNAV